MNGKVMEELENDRRIKSVYRGEYVSSVRKVGAGKVVKKITNIKADFLAEEFSGSISYVFVRKHPTDCFKLLERMLLLKECGFQPNFKIIVFAEKHEDLLITEEKGIVEREERLSSKELWNSIERRCRELADKIGVRFALKMI